ncbi:hypothetical protein [Dactylosporangium darangshiense]|uniref:hypothetical protein n=1 Tax=Dactylosporangium darangshiense TaxID=579108 RepID=UPI0031E81014
MTTYEPDWWSMLRALDEPIEPPNIRLESMLRPVDEQAAPGQYVLVESEAVAQLEQLAPPPGEGDGLEVPRDFDYAAARARFARLVERLSEVYGCPCDPGHPQDSACFGSIRVPAEATRTRTKRTRIPLSVAVLVSNFGALATYKPSIQGDQVAPVHPDDRQRIEEALTGLGYLVVPDHVLATPYDGPNRWVFGGIANATWFTRFFDYL